VPRNTESVAWGLGKLMPVLAYAYWQHPNSTRRQPLYTQADVQRVRAARRKGAAVTLEYRYKRNAQADTDPTAL